jgi:hypothetical protein
MPYKDPTCEAAKKSARRRAEKWRKANPHYAQMYQRGDKSRAYKLAWKKRHPEYPILAWQRQKERVFAMYGQVCARCGFPDKRALQLDHVQDDGHKHRRTRRDGRRTTDCRRAWTDASRSYQPDKFQILCSNCNWIKRAELCAKNQTLV